MKTLLQTGVYKPVDLGHGQPFMNTRMLFYCVSVGTFAITQLCAPAAGVTIITHGLNGNVDDWIIPMADKISSYSTFPGSNFSCYEIYFVAEGQGFRVANEWIGGVAPEDSDSGEILIKLDWRNLASISSTNSTYQVAEMVVPKLLETDFIEDLNGHALVEWPLHLIGHSRGGSLVCEMSRLLGLEGIWVDQVTTLDPRPLNNDGFMDGPLFTVIDATIATYENVLFADSYYQRLDSIFHGKDAPGSYVRQLTSLDGGYGGLAASHSDTHLWYHGTIDLATPATDTGASIEAAQRNDWWTPFESGGANAGYLYSRIGSGDRLSTNQPVASRVERIRDGMNQRWDFGAGVADNRASLDFNRGAWPNLIDLRVTGESELPMSGSLSVDYAFQYGLNAPATATLRIYLDPDENPLNANSVEIADDLLAATGSDQVAFLVGDIPLVREGLEPGEYSVAALVTNGNERRWIYAARNISLVAEAPAPVLSVVGGTPSGFALNIEAGEGRTVILESSERFDAWIPIATNLMSEGTWMYLDHSVSGGITKRFYRAFVE